MPMNAQHISTRGALPNRLGWMSVTYAGYFLRSHQQKQTTVSLLDCYCAWQHVQHTMCGARMHLHSVERRGQRTHESWISFHQLGVLLY
jgi:hypothetical protein